MEKLSLLDFILLPFYAVLLFSIAYRIRNRKYPKSHPWRKYFMPAFTLKIVGAIIITLIYIYYYGGGDTTNIFHNAIYINKTFQHSPGDWLDLILRRVSPTDPRYHDIWDDLYFYKDPSSFIICVFTAIINFFTFDNFLVTAMVFGFISFFGVWALFRTFAELYPAITKQIAWVTLFIPSTILWGSGVFKDTVCMFGLGWLTYSAFRMMTKKDFSFKNIIIAALSFFLLVKIKLYIAIAFTPALLFWLSNLYSNTFRNKGTRILMRLVLLSSIVGGSLFALDRLGGALDKYSYDRFVRTSTVTRGWIGYVSQTSEGSSYDLGEISSTLGGMLKKFPEAVNVTLFRPYPWEAGKAIVLLSSLEALLFFIFTLAVIVKLRPGRLLRIVFQNYTVQFCLIFTLIFAFAIGISSYNFGTLSRYRIPCLPFYGLVLVILYNYDFITRRSGSVINYSQNKKLSVVHTK
jgi:hypothetical protein